MSGNRAGAGPFGEGTVPDLLRGDLARRLAASAVLLPIVLAAVWGGGNWLAALLSAAAVVGSYELTRMATGLGSRPVVPVALTWSVGLVVAAHLHAVGQPLMLTVVPALAGGALISAAAVGVGRGPANWRGDFSATAGSALFAGGLLGFGALLRGLGDGAEWAVAMLLIIAAADVGAYAVGSHYGRHKLAPSISPGKSWEGAIAGLASAVAVAIALGTGFGLAVSVAVAAGLGALMWGGALAGDLLESGLKRRAGVKDSGGLIPGHGGLFDRLDSIVLNLVLCYCFVRWVVG